MAKEKTWRCADYCGACCKLDPEQRHEALNALSQNEQALYLSMVGKDGWCRFFDKIYRKCTIYNNRLHFVMLRKYQHFLKSQIKTLIILQFLVVNNI